MRTKLDGRIFSICYIYYDDQLLTFCCLRRQDSLTDDNNATMLESFLKFSTVIEFDMP